MANFALDSGTPQPDVLGSINYLLANMNTGGTSGNVGNVLVANTTTGQITNSTTGGVVAYLYRYICVVYANNPAGPISSSPTNQSYFGILNNSTGTFSTNPADYVWTQVTGGFDIYKYLYYSTTGGFQIIWDVATTIPSEQYAPVNDGQPIDLSVITSTPAQVAVSASVDPSVVTFLSSTGNTFVPRAQVIQANFTGGNIALVESGQITAAVDSTGNISLVNIILDSGVTVTTSGNNTPNASVTFKESGGVTVTSTAFSVINGTNGTDGANGTPGTSGLSSLNLPAFSLGNVTPRTPINGTWDFTTQSGTPPVDPASLFPPASNVALSGNVGVISRTDVTDNYIYYTLYPTSVGSSKYITFTVTGNTAIADIIVVGSGGDGGNQPNTPGSASGGNGGNVTVLSNVNLTTGSYQALFNQPSTTNNTYVQQSFAPFAILGGAGYGTAGTAIAYPTPGSGGTGAGGTYSGLNGGIGVGVPWTEVTWVGESYSGNVYFGSGGGGLTTFANAVTNYGLGGIGGGGDATSSGPSSASIASGAGGGATKASGTAGAGSVGCVIIRQHRSQAGFTFQDWTYAEPNITATQQVYQSTTLASTPNVSIPDTSLTWTTSTVAKPLPAPSMSVSYPQGQYITNNNGTYTPTPVGNIVTLTANIQAVRGNVILAAVDQVTQYFTANGTYSISSNVASGFNANALSFATPITSATTVYQAVEYSDIGGNVAGFISQALLKTTTGNTGPRGFTPMSYIVTDATPVGASSSQLTSWFTASRGNTVPPIGNGYAPLAQDVAQFFYPNLALYGGGVTVVKQYDGTNWNDVEGQVVSGDLVATGTITTSQLNANEVWTLQMASTNATFGSPSSAGFWMASQTGDARFAGNTSIGNALTVGTNAIIGDNLIVGNNAVIGQNVAIGANLGIGNNATIGSNLNVGSAATIGSNLTVGSFATIGANLTVGTHANVGSYLTVGDSAQIGQSANIGQFLVVGQSAYIGNDLQVGDTARIGNSATVGTNLTVGNNAVIGQNLIVGSNAQIGGNLNVSGLITGGGLQSNTVSTTTIVNNAVTNTAAIVESTGAGVNNPPMYYAGYTAPYYVYLSTGYATLANIVIPATVSNFTNIINGSMALDGFITANVTFAPFVYAQTVRKDLTTGVTTAIPGSLVYSPIINAYSAGSVVHASQSILPITIYAVGDLDQFTANVGTNYQYGWAFGVGVYTSTYPATVTCSNVYYTSETLTVTNLKR